MEEQKEGSLRLLTLNEVKLAKSVFGDSIEYPKVWIHHDSYLPFGLQNKDTAMTPNGELYFRQHYRSDFAVTAPPLQHLFIHEMSHVWQRSRGMNVIARGLMSWAVSYRYSLDGRPVRRYPMEQQAQIIADYFILNAHGYMVWNNLRNSGDITLDGDITEAVIKQQYQKAMQNFPWG
ncbi:type IV secretion protein Rhs [Erwiniaceae bacterium BAC15a-03b]|uniref:Type IV secretion protein Rhs n=1 Tax=Winslowiella arboricola TaxID=2978220 RepID=A0A9J6PKA2_9GAMM|nr:type IV secretion protein Rhs [Winslowiella arboricola]MCU5773103.1 type IV secretion protein Rhs [Winslowiella arboricola]MCU5777802.1 type IV secretion protein Rhs [Winslowiella arboricola]